MGEPPGGDRFGRFDDDSVIYRTDDRAQHVDRPRLVVAGIAGSLLGALLIAGADRALGRPLGALAVAGLLTVLLILYVLWRRRRNQRLTGSPTTWPGPSDAGRS